MQKLVTALLLTSCSLAQDPMTEILRETGRSNVASSIQQLTEMGIPIEPTVQTGLSGTKIFAYLLTDKSFHAKQIFPGDSPNVFTVQDVKRLVIEEEFDLGPIRARFSMHYDAGAKHVEGSTLFMNSADVNPVGDVKTRWLGLGVDDGRGVFLGRSPKPFGLEPTYLPGDTNVSVWKLSFTKHIRHGNMAAFPWLITFGDAQYNDNAYNNPDHLRRLGDWFIPAPVISGGSADARRASAQSSWRRFLNDNGTRNPAYLFGELANIGSGGWQAHLGKHPIMAVTSPHIASSYATDEWRSKLLWIEGKRKFFLNWPTVEANVAGSAYNFQGLHWISKWHSGFTVTSNGRGGYDWDPLRGDDHGITGYNLEHFRSRLPELAYYTADPQLMWMTAKLGYAIYCTLSTHSQENGGYYGGGFTNLRAWTRPLVELMEVVVALESFGDIYKTDAEFLEAHVSLKLSQLRTDHFLMSKYPNRRDEVIPGHEGEHVIESWQMGMSGDYFYSWWRLKEDQNALELATQQQKIHLASWRGTDSSNLQMAKHVLASDWNIGRAYTDTSLIHWNYSLMSVPGLPGIDQDRRRLIRDTIGLRNPRARRMEWGCGKWNGFQPVQTTPRFPWYMSN